MKKNQLVIFVTSFEDSLDCEKYFELSLLKYWPDCPYKLYLANNAEGRSNYSGQFPLISAPRSDWKGETQHQLMILKERHPECSHVLMMLDDFVFGSTVNTSMISAVQDLACRNELNYVRLRKVESSFIGSLVLKKDDSGLCLVPQRHPYYSSLQCAIWKIDHLLELLDRCGSIWNFEEQVGDFGHRSTGRTLLHYQHIVEKGMWDTSAEAWCVKTLGFFEPGDRETIRRSSMIRMKIMVSKISFFIFGYTLSRLRKTIRFLN